MNRSAARSPARSSARCAARSSGARGLAAAALSTLVVLVAGACSSGVTDAGSTTTPAPTVTVTQPATTPAGTAAAPAATTPADSPSSAASPAPSSAPPGTVDIPVPTVPVPTVPDLPSGFPTGATPTSPSSSAPVDVPLPTTDGATLPPGFPIPPGATVQGVDIDGQETAATVALTDAMAANVYWKSALPKAGYTVTHADSEGSTYEIRVAGHGYAGNSQIAIHGLVAVIQLDKG